MGLLDRDYYRDDGGGPIATWVRQGLVTKILFAVTALAFIVQISTQSRPDRAASGPFAEGLALNADRVLRGEVWRLITYAFLHPTAPNLFPFLFNMPLLWVVGHEAERRLGRPRFLAFYLGSAVLAGLALAGAAYLNLRGASPERTFVVSCAAPLTALLAWLVMESPRLRLTFFYALPVPVWALLAAAVGTDVVGLVWPALTPEDGRHVTLAGHFGGLLAGLLFHGVMRSARGGRRRWQPPSDPDLRIYRDEPPGPDDDEVPAPVPANPDLDEHLEAQLDAVLAKVAAHGQASLTSAERAILNRASEVYRKRRR